MNLIRLVLAFVRRAPLTWAFHVLSLALGVAVVTALLIIDRAIDQRFDRDLAHIDLVIGAKGSPLQIILSSVFQLDQPTGNIPLEVYQRLKTNMLVRDAVPVSLGDNVGGFRIVGTTPLYATLYDARLEKGDWWHRPLEAVLGSTVAHDRHLGVGDVFVGEHGLARGGELHTHSPYHVVGILAPTGAVIDRVALTDTASIWKVHEHENAEHAAAASAIHAAGSEEPDLYPAVGREVTSVLVRYRSAMGALMLPRLFASEPKVQTASPAIEVARLTRLLGTGSDVLKAFGIGLLALSALGFFVALLSAVGARKRELALLRALGARPGLLLRLVLLEALVLGALGGALGLALGHVSSIVAARITAGGGGPALAPGSLGLLDGMIFLAAVLLSLGAAVPPALYAYRLRPAEVLKA